MEHATHSTSSLMDRTHADGMWFSSWENSFALVFWLEEGRKKKQTTSSEWEPLGPKMKVKKDTQISERLICVLMFPLVPASVFFLFVCLFSEHSPPAAPTAPCITVPAPLYGLKSFSMHLKIFMNPNTVILLQQLSASSECRRKPTYRVTFADSSIKVHLGSAGDYWLTIGRTANGTKPAHSVLWHLFWKSSGTNNYCMYMHDVCVCVRTAVRGFSVFVHFFFMYLRA